MKAADCPRLRNACHALAKDEESCLKWDENTAITFRCIRKLVMGKAYEETALDQPIDFMAVWIEPS